MTAPEKFFEKNKKSTCIFKKVCYNKSRVKGVAKNTEPNTGV